MAAAATASSTGALALTCSSTDSNLPTGASLPIGATVEFAVRPGRKGDEAHDVTLV